MDTLLTFIETIRPKCKEDVFVVNQIAEGWTHTLRNKYFGHDTPTDKIAEYMQYAVKSYPAEAVDARIEKDASGTVCVNAVFTKCGKHRLISIYAYKGPSVDEMIYDTSEYGVRIGSVGGNVKFIGQQQQSGIWKCKSTNFGKSITIVPLDERNMPDGARLWKLLS